MSGIRPARMDDLEDAAALLNRHSRALHGADDVTLADLRLYWETPDVQLGADVLVAEGSDGALVGYADLGEQGDQVWLDVRATDPEVGPALLDAIERRAAEKRPGAKLWGFTADSDEALRDLYESSGYELVRHSFRMRINLDGDQPAPDWPAGIAVRTMREGEEWLFYDAYVSTFADTWRFHAEPFETWAHWMIDDEVFDPSLCFAAEAEGMLAGIVIARVAEHEPGLGWIRILGVMPEHRRKGLGHALLLHTFGEFARRGFSAVGLGVDGENPTGAVRLYERAGMHVSRTNLLFEKVQR